MSDEAEVIEATRTFQLTVEEVTLDTPIVRGKQKISDVAVRKPKAGELRGIQMQALMQGDANAMIAVLPRITMPPLLPYEVEALEADDFATLVGTVMGFFYTKAERDMLARMMGQPTSTS